MDRRIRQEYLADLAENLLLLGQVGAHHVSTRSAAAAVAADKAFGEMGTYVHRIDINKTDFRVSLHI